MSRRLLVVKMNTQVNKDDKKQQEIIGSKRNLH